MRSVTALIALRLAAVLAVPAAAQDKPRSGGELVFPVPSEPPTRVYVKDIDISNLSHVINYSVPESPEANSVTSWCLRTRPSTSRLTTASVPP